jgi:hypothetical protein
LLWKRHRTSVVDRKCECYWEKKAYEKSRTQATAKTGKHTKQNVKCIHCVKDNHASFKCRFKNAICHACNAQGHIKVFVWKHVHQTYMLRRTTTLLWWLKILWPKNHHYNRDRRQTHTNGIRGLTFFWCRENSSRSVLQKWHFGSNW